MTTSEDFGPDDSCVLCGALVLTANQAKHARWHDRLDLIRQDVVALKSPPPAQQSV